jgi:hypothetical protein
LREETDLDQLTGNFAAAARTTMQPETVSVWIGDSEKIAETSSPAAKASGNLAENPPTP